MSGYRRFAKRFKKPEYCVHVFPLTDGKKMAYQSGEYGLGLRSFPVLSCSGVSGNNKFCEMDGEVPYYTRDAVRSVVIRRLISVLRSQGRPEKCVRNLKFLLNEGYPALSKSDALPDIFFMLFKAIHSGSRPDLAFNVFRTFFLGKRIKFNFSKLHLHPFIITSALNAYLCAPSGDEIKKDVGIGDILNCFKHGSVDMHKWVNKLVQDFAAKADPVLLARYFNSAVRSEMLFAYLRKSYRRYDLELMGIFCDNILQLNDKMLLTNDDSGEIKALYKSNLQYLLKMFDMHGADGGKELILFDVAEKLKEFHLLPSATYGNCYEKGRFECPRCNDKISLRFDGSDIQEYSDLITNFIENMERFIKLMPEYVFQEYNELFKMCQMDTFDYIVDFSNVRNVRDPSVSDQAAFTMSCDQVLQVMEEIESKWKGARFLFVQELNDYVFNDLIAQKCGKLRVRRYCPKVFKADAACLIALCLCLRKSIESGDVSKCTKIFTRDFFRQYRYIVDLKYQHKWHNLIMGVSECMMEDHSASRYVIYNLDSPRQHVMLNDMVYCVDIERFKEHMAF